MDSADLEVIQKAGEDRLGETLTVGYSPSNIARAKMYMSWLDKQVRQRQKTLELDGVTHSREQKEWLRKDKKLHYEEYKRIKDAIEDGDIK